MLTKEKSTQKRKDVNNQNNSIELLPIIDIKDYDDELNLNMS